MYGRGRPYNRMVRPAHPIRPFFHPLPPLFGPPPFRPMFRPPYTPRPPQEINIYAFGDFRERPVSVTSPTTPVSASTGSSEMNSRLEDTPPSEKGPSEMLEVAPIFPEASRYEDIGSVTSTSINSEHKLYSHLHHHAGHPRVLRVQVTLASHWSVLHVILHPQETGAVPGCQAPLGPSCSDVSDPGGQDIGCGGPGQEPVLGPGQQAEKHHDPGGDQVLLASHWSMLSLLASYWLILCILASHWSELFISP